MAYVVEHADVGMIEAGDGFWLRARSAACEGDRKRDAREES